MTETQNTRPANALEERPASDSPVALLAAEIETLSAAMNAAAALGGGAAMDFAAVNLREAAILARRRASSVGHVGPRSRREMGKTLLVELTRGILAARNAFPGMPPEELETVLRAAAHALEDLARRDPTLFHPPGLPQEADWRAEPELNHPDGWLSSGLGFLHGPSANGIMLSAEKVPAFSAGGGTVWMARLGGTGVEMLPDAEAAARAAVAAYARVFGPLDSRELPEAPE